MYGRNQKIRIIDYEDSLFVKTDGKPIGDCIITNFRRIG